MLNFGDIVLVKAFPNQTLTRRVVAVIDNETVLLCNEEEFQSALKEHRKPTAIGFPIYDVIESKNDQKDKKR